MKIKKDINPHFEEFIFDWSHKHYFLLGGYGSGKSYSVALKIILKLLQEKRTALVVREVFETLRESCFSLFVEIIEEFNLQENKTVTITLNPLKIKFYNGSKIIFRGMDKPEKVKSINGVSILWAEEASEVKYSAYKELLTRLRHEKLSLHFILTTNPVNKTNWVYRHFFVDGDRIILSDEELYEKRKVVLGGVYYLHSVADDNLFLPKDYIEQLDDLETYDKELYRIGRKGRFGYDGVRVLPNLIMEEHSLVMEKVSLCRLRRVGMDFGFEVSYNAVVRMAVDEKERVLYVYWEYFKNKMTDDKTAKELEEFAKSQELIYGDSAEPKTIQYFRQQGFNIKGAKKFPGSRIANIKKLRRFKKIIISDSCTNCVAELMDLVYAKDREGEVMWDTYNRDAHTLSAIWYGLDEYNVADIKDRQSYSGKGTRQ